MNITLRILGLSVVALGACVRTNPGFLIDEGGGSGGQTSSAGTSGPSTSESTFTGSGTGTTMGSDGMTVTSVDPDSSGSSESSGAGGTGFDGVCVDQEVPTPMDITLTKAGVVLAEQPCGTEIKLKTALVESMSANDVVLRACAAGCDQCDGEKYTIGLDLADAVDYLPVLDVGQCLNMTAHFAAYSLGEKMCKLSQIGLANPADPMPFFVASVRMSAEAVAAPELTQWKAFPSLKAKAPMKCACGGCCALNKYLPGNYALDFEVRLYDQYKGYPVDKEDLGQSVGQYMGQDWKVDIKVVQAYVTGTCAEEPHVQWVARAYPG